MAKNANKNTTVLDVLKNLQDEIQSKLEAFKSYEKADKNLPQYKQTRANLENAVKNYIDSVTNLIADKKLHSDPVGILSMDSLFGEIVDEIAENYIKSLRDETKIAAVIENGQKVGFFGKIKFHLCNGAKIVWNAATSTVTVIWNGIKATFSWVGKKVSQFWEWLKSLFSANDQKKPA